MISAVIALGYFTLMETKRGAFTAIHRDTTSHHGWHHNVAGETTVMRIA